MKEVAQGKHIMWQQDSAPCHTSKRSLEWLEDNFEDFIGPDFWPPNSPDLNPLDYFVWGAVERHNNKSPCNTVNELKQRIQNEFNNLPKAMVEKACSRFRPRIEKVIANGGGFIN